MNRALYGGGRQHDMVFTLMGTKALAWAEQEIKTIQLSSDTPPLCRRCALVLSKTLVIEYATDNPWVPHLVAIYRSNYKYSEKTCNFALLVAIFCGLWLCNSP